MSERKIKIIKKKDRPREADGDQAVSGIRQQLIDQRRELLSRVAEIERRLKVTGAKGP